MFRTIRIDIKASDDAPGIWQTGVWYDPTTLPVGVWLWVETQTVNWSGSIETPMDIYAEPAALPGTYSITIVAGWTTILGSHWETRSTFTLQVLQASENDWTQNPQLLLQNAPNPTAADKWYPGVRQWETGSNQNWPVSSSPSLYANWNVSGRVDLHAEADTISTIDQVAHVVQGLPEGIYQPPTIPLSLSETQVNLKAAVTNIFTSVPASPIAWTGIKWDLYAIDTKDNRTLYIELYFIRTGGNLDWQDMANIPPSFRNLVHAFHNEVLESSAANDDALLAVDADASNEPFVKFVNIVNISPTMWFSIDLSRMFGYVASEYASYFPDMWNSSRTVDDYNLYQVALCLEAYNSWPGADVIPSARYLWRTLR
jgi:hypothetical protein